MGFAMSKGLEPLLFGKTERGKNTGIKKGSNTSTRPYIYL